MLHQEGRLSSASSGQWRTSRPRRRSRSSSRHHSRMPALRDWSGHSCCLPPNMLLRCHCRGPTSPGTDTMPKLASAVNVLAYAHSSHSGGVMAWASLDNEDAWEDDFQTLHTHVHCKVGRMGVAMENWPQRGWKPPGEAPAGNHIIKWMLVRRRQRHLSPLILIGGPPTGSKWWSRALPKK